MRKGKRKDTIGGAATVQLRQAQRQPFGALDSYVPMGNGEIKIYRAIREAVPIVDAAIMKIIRLVGGFTIHCNEGRAEKELQDFLRRVPVGRGQFGVNAFIDQYLDSLLTCGSAIGEIVPAGNRRDIAALLCGNVEDIEIRQRQTPLEFAVCGYDKTGMMRELPRQELLLFTPFQPESDAPYGVSLLRSMPFLTNILLQIYQAIGQNWERMGNVRYAVVYRPQGDELDRNMAKERSEQIAREWGAAMQSSKNGNIRDFVAVGDVEIRAIGADNQILDSEIPVRQILEELIARTGIPPFMLGLNWSSTERMSSQQADLLTTEMTAIRRTLTPTIERICGFWMRLHGYGGMAEIEWDAINLQDEVEDAKAELYIQQARKLRIENDREEL